MNPNTPNTPESSNHHHLGIRLAVGAVGLLLLALFVLLGQVAMKQSATHQALETHETLKEEGGPATATE